MLKKILLGLAALVVLLIVGAIVAISMQPDSFNVQRSLGIAAPPAEVFHRLNDFAEWDSWSPWKDLDPAAKKTVSTPSAGKGATYSWSGNDQVGEGKLTIVESVPDKQVGVEQEFVRPIPGKARLDFLIVADAAGSNVTFKMQGTNNFLGKAMCMVFDMDAMLGKDFEAGLANLKNAVERKGGAKDAAATSK